MNNLFEFDENFDVVVAPIALTLKPFKDVLDKYKEKRLGIIELSYITFLCNPKSDYADIRDMKERSEAILQSIVDGAKITPDDITKCAIDFYNERSHTPTTKYLDSALNALDKVAKYFDSVDFLETDKFGKLVHEPKKVTDLLSATPKLMEGLRVAREAIKKEQELEGGIRGSGQKGIYEDGN
jgi:hypothetical protein